MPELNPDVREIADALRNGQGCHTAILYGSFATGDATPESDFDVAGFADISETRRIAGKWRHTCLDAFVYPESKLANPTQELLHLRGGTVLFERADAGKRLLEQVESIYAHGPERLPDDEARMRRHWAWKMLDRAARDRRVWLLTVLLEDYFVLRGRWYEGPKKSLAYLKTTEPELHFAFEQALRPGAGLEAISRVVDAVAGPRSERSMLDESMRPC